VRETAERRSDGEYHHAGDEHVSRTEDVAQASRGDQEHGIHQAVAIEHPQDLVERCVQVVDDAGDRDVDDGQVEQGHEETQREYRQRQPGRRRSYGFGHGGVNPPWN
jgi:hypothetical protein